MWNRPIKFHHCQWSQLSSNVLLTNKRVKFCYARFCERDWVRMRGSSVNNIMILDVQCRPRSFKKDALESPPRTLGKLQDHLSSVELANQISLLPTGPVVNSATFAVCVVAHKQKSEIGLGVPEEAEAVGATLKSHVCRNWTASLREPVSFTGIKPDEVQSPKHVFREHKMLGFLLCFSPLTVQHQQRIPRIPSCAPLLPWLSLALCTLCMPWKKHA